MQTQKENIRRVLLRVARSEFLKTGFKNTSMRTIAQKAGVGLSNIYNYFENKDQLFAAILAPTVQALNRLLDEHNSEANLQYDFVTSADFPKQMTRFVTELIVQHRDELKILLFNSHGSALESFKEELIERHTSCELEYMRLLKKEYPQVNIEISEFFVHTSSSWWFSTIGELVMHELSRDELERFVGEYMEYATAGWRKLMGVQ